MQIQFQYITELARQYKNYSENQDFLFEAINNLPQNRVEEIFKDYGDTERDFTPVNFLRAEIARRLLNNVHVYQVLVNEIKDKIRNKDLDYFKYYPETFLKQLQEYELSTRDILLTGKNPGIFFIHFFTGVR
jgi:5-methylcytosine-specific restriction enzyme B